MVWPGLDLLALGDGHREHVRHHLGADFLSHRSASSSLDAPAID